VEETLMVVTRKKIGGATLHLLPLDFMAAPQSQHRTVFGIFIFLSFFFVLNCSFHFENFNIFLCFYDNFCSWEHTVWCYRGTA